MTARWANPGGSFAQGHLHPMSAPETGSTNKLDGLYQCQYPGFDLIAVEDGRGWLRGALDVPRISLQVPVNL